MNKNKTLIIVLSSLASVGLLLMWGLYNLLFPATTYLKYGLLNRQGQFVIPPQFDRLSDSSDGSYLGKNYAYDDQDWKFWHCCLYNHKGHLQECSPCNADPPKEQLDVGLRQSDLGYFGEQNTTDKQLVMRGIRIAPDFDDWLYTYFGLTGHWEIVAEQTQDGHSVLKSKPVPPHKSLYGYTNQAGKWVIPPKKWNLATNFSQGLAFVWIKGEPYGKWGIINTKGEYVLKPTCAHIWPFENDRAKCQVAFNETRFIFSKPEVDKALKGE